MGGQVVEGESWFLEIINMRYLSGIQVEISRGTWIKSWNSAERLGSHDYVKELKATGLGEAT